MSLHSARQALLNARRGLTASIIGAAAVAAVVLPATAANAAGSCDTAACITNVSIQPGGLSAAVVFDTTVPTTDHFELSYNNAVVAQANYATAATHHQLTSPSTLDPNTTYTWLLSTTDGRGHSMSRAGTLTTLHRQVDVMFSTVTITNDSDDDSSGELKAWDRVGSVSRVNSVMPEDVSDAQTVVATDVIRVKDTGATTPVFTEIMDNDSFNPFLPSSQLGFPANASWNNGKDWAFDWATATKTLPTRNVTNGWKAFDMTVDANVGFVMHAFFSVTYVS